jgi:O-antigen ligase/polysaccharide polymerase Wzy-like membrane protein
MRDSDDAKTRAATVRGVAQAPDSSVVPAPIVGVVVRSSDRDPIPAREWALYAMIVGYPLWRMLGMTLFIVPLLAVPMALELLRRRRLRYPAGIAIWMLFLAIGLLSIVMLGKTAPGALPPDPGFGRYLAYGQRMADYVTALIILLYVGNLTERELPAKRVAKMLAALFVMVALGGLLSLFAPHITITTPVGKLLPHSLAINPFVVHLVNVQFAQYQDVLSQLTGARPAFPFQYTNTWGQCLVLLLPWFLIATMRGPKTMFQRIWPIVMLLIALIPTIYSLNRGMWIGIGIGLLYLIVRLAARGKTLPAVIVFGAAAIIGIIVLTTPLSGVIVGRINTPDSNAGRAEINAAAVTAAKSSPIIGYGGQDSFIGSGRSIAIGPSATCSQCGSRDIGSDGQLWLLLITEGFVGAALYCGFFLRFAWRYRRDPSWIGLAGGATVILSLWFMTVYTALELPLMIMMITLALWWRNERTREYQ